MQDGFIRVAAASPSLQVAHCTFNATHIVEAAHRAAESKVRLLAFPELGITGATCGDLFLQPRLLDEAETALKAVCEGTAMLEMVLVVGIPLRHRGKLYNCAAVLNKGHVLGLVPKSYPANYGASYELRHFSPAFSGIERYERGFLKGVPIGAELLFRCDGLQAFTFGIEIGEDLWVAAPPSIFHAASGANLIVNLSANAETVGRAATRRALLQAQSAKLICGYLYANAGAGESSTDLVFSGHSLISEFGDILAEAKPFGTGFAASELDLGRLAHERLRNTTFSDAGGEGYLVIGFALPLEETALTRPIAASPFVPEDPAALAEHCKAVLNIQAAGLRRRLEHSGAKTAVVGVSGGLDSTLALLVAVRAFSAMGLPAANILAVSMPGFGTTARTKTNAAALCAALGVTLKTVPIADTVRAHFKDIGHSEGNTDLVYENAQARMRTLTLMDMANQQGGLVVGTGDLSELSLGWATYNGDHMSMYAVNASVPKTLIRTLLAHLAQQQPTLASILQDILDTPVSPELLPVGAGEAGQETEALVGPYELHDFFLYYTLRWAFAPAKILRLALAAFGTRYSRAELLKWMRVFYTRFFSQQYKRSCLPDGPKVGSVSLSPRGDWRMPSDASASAWVKQLDELDAQI